MGGRSVRCATKKAPADRLGVDEHPVGVRGRVFETHGFRHLNAKGVLEALPSLSSKIRMMSSRWNLPRTEAACYDEENGAT